MTWTVERYTDGVEALHLLGIPDPVSRTVRVFTPNRSAVVLGSTQPESDARRIPGTEIVRRRSGGGAVLVEPNNIVWIDVLIPKKDALWQDDVGKAFWWLGDVWVDALQSVGVVDAKVHTGALVESRWSKMICFAGLGPGEVTVGGKKLVGISQRRVRQGSLFQCAVPIESQVAIVKHLNLDSGASKDASDALRDATVTVELARANALVGAFVDALNAQTLN